MIFKRLVLFGLLLLHHSVDAAELDWHQAQYITDSFFEIALKSEYSKQPQVVRKWPITGIRYHYIHRVMDNRLHEELTELHLRHLQMITGLSIKQVKDVKDANLTIVFSREDSLKADLQNFFDMKSPKDQDYFYRNGVCLGNFSSQADSAIQKATVIIPVDRARKRGKLLACVVEELTQILGLANDSDSVFPSIFNDHSINNLLTGLDYTLLKILYDQRLHTGMNKSEATPVVESIVKEFIKSGLVDNADKRVQSGGLYSLLGEP